MPPTRSPSVPEAQAERRAVPAGTMVKKPLSEASSQPAADMAVAQHSRGEPAALEVKGPVQVRQHQQGRAAVMEAGAHGPTAETVQAAAVAVAAIYTKAGGPRVTPMAAADRLEALARSVVTAGKAG